MCFLSVINICLWLWGTLESSHARIQALRVLGWVLLQPALLRSWYTSKQTHSELGATHIYATSSIWSAAAILDCRRSSPLLEPCEIFITRCILSIYFFFFAKRLNWDPSQPSPALLCFADGGGNVALPYSERCHFSPTHLFHHFSFPGLKIGLVFFFVFFLSPVRVKTFNIEKLRCERSSSSSDEDGSSAIRPWYVALESMMSSEYFIWCGYLIELGLIKAGTEL